MKKEIKTFKLFRLNLIFLNDRFVDIFLYCNYYKSLSQLLSRNNRYCHNERRIKNKSLNVKYNNIDMSS